MMTLILHITTIQAWDEARSIGIYGPESLQREGFIHFSGPDQVLRVANDFYHGRQDLVLLVVDSKRLTSELRWEAPVHPAGVALETPADEQFPHLYGPLNVDAVIRVMDFQPGPEGEFTVLDL